MESEPLPREGEDGGDSKFETFEVVGNLPGRKNFLSSIVKRDKEQRR